VNHKEVNGRSAAGSSREEEKPAPAPVAVNREL